MSPSQHEPTLGERTQEALRTEAPEARVNRMWAGIERRRAPLTSPLLRFAPLAGIAMAAAAVLALGTFAWSEESGPLSLAGGAEVPPSMSESSHVFADGSRIDADGQIDTLSNVDGEIAFALRSGAAHFDIVPDGPRRWRVVAGAVEVVVVGTVFDVERSEASVQVSVERGVVLVRGGAVPDGEQRLEAGATLRVPVVPLQGSVARAASARDDSVEVEPVELESVEVDAFELESAEVASLEERANAGSSHAIAEEPRAPGEDAHRGEASGESEESLSLDALLELADEARRERRYDEAVQWLRRAARDFPGEPRAALAAFTQGRIELESLHRPAPAARSFAQSLRHGLPSPLRETAEALRVQGLHRGGDPAAEAAAEDFLARYPESEYRPQVLEALGRSTP